MSWELKSSGNRARYKLYSLSFGTYIAETKAAMIDKSKQSILVLKLTIYCLPAREIFKPYSCLGVILTIGFGHKGAI